MTWTCNRLLLRSRKGNQEFKQTILYARLRTGSAYPQTCWNQVSSVCQPPSTEHSLPALLGSKSSSDYKTVSPKPQPCIHHCVQTTKVACSTTQVLKVHIIVTKNAPRKKKSVKCTSQTRKRPLFIPAFTKTMSNTSCHLTELQN